MCSRLARSRQGIICELVSILSAKNSENNVRSLTKDPQCLTQLILDCSVTVDAELLDMDDDMLDRIEKWSRNICFELHQKPSDILGLSIRK